MRLTLHGILLSISIFGALARAHCSDPVNRLFGQSEYRRITRERDYVRILGLDGKDSVSNRFSETRGLGVDPIYEMIRAKAIPEYQSFLKPTPSVWKHMSTDQKKDALFDYLDGVFQSFSPEQVARIQDDSLRQLLARHGVKNIAPGQGRAALERVSRDNVERYLKGKRYVLGSVPEMRDFEAYANAEYIWNSHFSHFGGERIVPTVSARQLEKMGFAGGANSQNPYNRQFLRSDDQVYFQLFLQNKTPRIDLPKIEKTSSEYGDKSFKLAEDYLHQHAWVSPDTMRADDFVRMAKVLAPDLWKQVTERMSRQELLFLSFKKLDNVLPPEFITIRKMSHRLDFTADDFRNLFSQLFLQEMDALRQSNPAEFRKALETIRAPHTQEAEVKKSNLYYKTSENFPELHLSFDMKVPAFVPADKLIPQ